jgi:hypothetical protein
MVPVKGAETDNYSLSASESAHSAHENPSLAMPVFFVASRFGSVLCETRCPLFAITHINMTGSVYRPLSPYEKCPSIE